MRRLAPNLLLALVVGALPLSAGAADVEDAADPAPVELQSETEVLSEPLPEAEAPTRRRFRDLKTGIMPGGDLFGPLIADPRWPHFSFGYQYYINDPTFKDIGAVSFGETFTVYRLRLGSGLLEFGAQAGVFAIFDLDSSSFDLINADYMVALTTAYRLGQFSVLGRVFHQSSHLGDEFLLRSTTPARVNLSYESVDLKLSYDFDAIRLYGGGGYLFDTDPSDLQPWSVQAGLEFRSPWPSLESRWRPIAAVDLQSREQNDWDIDVSVRAGIQIDGVLASRSMQFLVEYFHGHSPNGQFFTRKVDYIGLGVHFHF
ncbi:MAG TPA: DUF1207 domain-containing protein [Methylomirabilota bacterium]|jgi:hypothetical protein